MNPYFIGLLVPVVCSFLIRKEKNPKKRGVQVDVGGEQGYAIRNHRSSTPIETAWEGISTLPELFENSCKLYSSRNLLGSRELISRETEVTEDGRSFEKLHLGTYQWISYGQTFADVSSFASGLVGIGHGKGERVAIFADTRAEWFVALQVFLQF